MNFELKIKQLVWESTYQTILLLMHTSKKANNFLFPAKELSASNFKIEKNKDYRKPLKSLHLIKTVVELVVSQHYLANKIPSTLKNQFICGNALETFLKFKKGNCENFKSSQFNLFRKQSFLNVIIFIVFLIVSKILSSQIHFKFLELQFFDLKTLKSFFKINLLKIKHYIFMLGLQQKRIFQAIFNKIHYTPFFPKTSLRGLTIN